MKVSRTATIERPPDDVWAIVDDPESQPEWQEELDSYEQLTGRPDRVGGTARMVYLVDGSEREVTATLLERAAPSRLLWEIEGMPVRFTVEQVVTAGDQGNSEVTTTLDAKIGLLQKPLTPVIKPLFERAVTRLSESLKAYAESR